uniref:Nucleos_tra2_C domain-containing protein n=1 Tax=Strongyloides venezuelensis TaxID=75913 RepID=A0A0K0EXJ9_STRVS
MQKYLSRFENLDIPELNKYYDIGGFIGCVVPSYLALKGDFNFLREFCIFLVMTLSGTFYAIKKPLPMLFGVVGFSIAAAMNFMETLTVRNVSLNMIGKSPDFISTVANIGSMTVGVPFKILIKRCSIAIIPQLFIMEIILYGSFKFFQNSSNGIIEKRIDDVQNIGTKKDHGENPNKIRKEDKKVVSPGKIGEKKTDLKIQTID